MKYLYDRRGEAVAVLEGRFVFDLEGYPRGFVEGTQVYRMSGEYVGEVYQDMVVETFASKPGSGTPPVPPGRIPPPEKVPGRGAVDYGMPSRIERLFE